MIGLIDVIIPVYKPDKRFLILMERLKKQTVPIHEVLVIHTRCKGDEWEEVYEKALEQYDNVTIYHLNRDEFDHGGTRHFAMEQSKADIVVLMTQDALPANVKLIEKLTRNLTGNVAAAYARQLPTKNCCVFERFTRQFNYPAQSKEKSFKDLPILGVKTFFCSNVCAAYKKNIYDDLGGFIKRTIFNEDMIYASKAIKEGFVIRYEAEACVYHSHNYSNLEQLRRNFDLGVSQVQHPEVFAAITSEAEGTRLVKEATQYLIDQKQYSKLPHFYLQCASKYAGYLLGKNYKYLPKKAIERLTMNKEYWKAGK